MEENHTDSVQPFNKADLRVAKHAFRFVHKCESTINRIVSDVDPHFGKWFHTRARFTKGHFSNESAYSYTKNFRWPGITGITITIYIAPEGGALGHGLAVELRRNYMKRLNRFLSWHEGDGEIYTWRPISVKVDRRSMVNNVWMDFKELRSALNRAF
jgi:hypothetical protein